MLWFYNANLCGSKPLFNPTAFSAENREVQIELASFDKCFLSLILEYSQAC